MTRPYFASREGFLRVASLHPYHKRKPQSPCPISFAQRCQLSDHFDDPAWRRFDALRLRVRSWSLCVIMIWRLVRLASSFVLIENECDGRIMTIMHDAHCAGKRGESCLFDGHCHQTDSFSMLIFGCDKLRVIVRA